MKKPIDLFRRPPVHLGSLGKLLQTRLPNGFLALEVTHQRLPSYRPDPRNLIQNGFNLGFAPQTSVVFDGKPMSLVLNKA